MRPRPGAALLALAITVTACSSSAKPAATPSSPPTSAGATTVPAPTSLPAADIVREASADAQREGWVHVDVSIRQSGKTITFSQDSGPGTGRQTVTIGAQKATVVLIDRIAYLDANAAALRGYGLAPGSAAYAGKWLSVKPSDSNYGAVASGVTLEDVLKQISIKPPLAKERPSTVDGRRVIGVNGSAATNGDGPEPGTLYVPASGEILPVAFDFSDPAATDRVRFSAWGRAVRLSAPAHPIAMSSIISQVDPNATGQAKRRNSVI